MMKIINGTRNKTAFSLLATARINPMFAVAPQIQDLALEGMSTNPKHIKDTPTNTKISDGPSLVTISLHELREIVDRITQTVAKAWTTKTFQADKLLLLKIRPANTQTENPIIESANAKSTSLEEYQRLASPRKNLVCNIRRNWYPGLNLVDAPQFPASDCATKSQNSTQEITRSGPR
jgi:hypothetical protein